MRSALTSATKTSTYDQKIATMVTEWVLHMYPVKGMQDFIKEDAVKGYNGYANKLYSTANSEFVPISQG